MNGRFSPGIGSGPDSGILELFSARGIPSSAIQLRLGSSPNPTGETAMPVSMMFPIVMTLIVAIIAVHRWIVVHHDDRFY